MTDKLAEAVELLRAAYNREAGADQRIADFLYDLPPTSLAGKNQGGLVPPPNPQAADRHNVYSQAIYNGDPGDEADGDNLRRGED